jgi:hypothetical protein
MADRFAARNTGIKRFQVNSLEELTVSVADADVVSVSMMWRNNLIARADDAWFERYENHWLSPLLGGKIDAVMQVADTVVAGNQYLARRARQVGAHRVEIVPTAIDIDRYQNLSPAGPRRRLPSAGSAFRSTRTT